MIKMDIIEDQNLKRNSKLTAYYTSVNQLKIKSELIIAHSLNCIMN